VNFLSKGAPAPVVNCFGFEKQRKKFNGEAFNRVLVKGEAFVEFINPQWKRER
jgi:hypothetical protein